MAVGQDNPSGAGAPRSLGAGGSQPSFDFVEHYDQQIAAKDREITDVRAFEEQVQGSLGADQWGTSRVPSLERERESLVSERQVFVDGRENAQAVAAAQGGNPWPLTGRVAEAYGSNPLAGLGAGHVAESMLGRLAAGLGRLRAGGAAARAGAVNTAAAPSPLQLCPPEVAPLPTAADQVRALPGHGDVRHGSQTTVAEQTTRVLTGVTPDGKALRPPRRATRFDSPEAQLDAVDRATSKTQADEASGKIDTAIRVNSNGEVRLPRNTVVVSGLPGGYGSGVQRQPGTPPRVASTGQDQNALVVLEKEPLTGSWRAITQYPTNSSPTP